MTEKMEKFSEFYHNSDIKEKLFVVYVPKLLFQIKITLYRVIENEVAMQQK